MSGPAGQHPGRWVVKLIRGGDLLRAVCTPEGKSRGRCTDPACEWPGPAGTGPHNISRELMRHARKTGHRTRFVTVEVVEYRPARSDRPERGLPDIPEHDICWQAWNLSPA